MIRMGFSHNRCCFQIFVAHLEIIAGGELSEYTFHAAAIGIFFSFTKVFVCKQISIFRELASIYRKYADILK